MAIQSNHNWVNHTTSMPIYQLRFSCENQSSNSCYVNMSLSQVFKHNMCRLVALAAHNNMHPGITVYILHH